MRNPFEYGGSVRSTAFYNRQRELPDLTRAMSSAEELFVLSERRMGRTSPIRAALRKLPKRERVCAYVDL